jgi:eukaryotic-like serine/threonine-protein kinase
MYANRPLMLGRYRLLAELGRGGMADVYLAASDGPGGHRQLDVIKRLRNLEDPQHMTMFLDEARIARRLSHPNIVKTYEIGQDAGSHFIAMEYLHGPTLQRLRSAAATRQQRVPWAMEIKILCSVLEGLHYAHELCGPDGRALHVVHRDLSPENVIVTQSGECKILDFGIAKAIDSLTHTQAGFIKGKLKNMPPEQLHGHRVDRRADVYAVGVMLWEGLTARPLWGDLGNAAIATRLAQGSLPPLQDPSIPDELREMCARALEVTPDRRFPTALDFKESLLQYVEQNHLDITRSQLAEFVEPLFAEERERIDRIVQTLLYANDPSVLDTGPVPLPSAEAFTAVGRTPPRRRASETRVLASGLQTGDSELVIVPRRRWKPALALGTMLMLGLTIFTVSLRSSAPPIPSPTPAVVPPPSPAEAARPEPTTSPRPTEAVATGQPPSPERQTAPEAAPAASPIDQSDEPPAARHPPRKAGRARPAGRATTSRRSAIEAPPRPAYPTRPPELPPPRAVSDEQPIEETRVRWLGRGLDRRNPYNGANAPASAPAQAGSKRGIDKNNPWQGGN